MFINHGRIVLDCAMDSFETRYVELSPRPESLGQARALKPIHERQALGRSTLIYDSVNREQLAGLGDVHTPSIADVFVAIMSEPALGVAA
jgi:ABC-2 type transport system ATP-binding protein